MKYTNKYAPLISLFTFGFLLFISTNSNQLRAQNDTAEAVLRGHKKGVTDLVFSPSGDSIISSSLDGTIRIWDLLKKSREKIINTNNGEIYAVAVSSNGTFIASTGKKGKILLTNAIKGITEKVFSELKGWSQTVVFSPDGKQIAAPTGSGTITIWRVDSKGHNRIIKSKRQPTTLAWSPDGKTLAGGSFNITIWNAKTGKVNKILRGHSYTIRSVSFSKDGKFLASASLDKTVRIWDVEKGKILLVLKPKGFSRYWQGKPITDPIDVPILAAEFSPDGKYVATAGADRMIRFWEINTGKLIRTILGHKMSITALSFSPDGKYLASSSLDRTIRIWNLHKETKMNRR